MGRGVRLLSLRESVFSFATFDDKRIVVAVQRPWTGWNFLEIDKTPIGQIGIPQLQIIPDRRRDVETSSTIQVRTRPIAAENVLPMIAAKRADIFPLGVANPISSSDRHPPTFQNTLTGFFKRLPEPRNDLVRLRFRAASTDVIKGKS